MKKIVVKDLINSDLAVTAEKAKIIKKEIVKNIESDNPVSLDFSGIDTLTTAFLNVAVGELYEFATPDKLNELVKFELRSLTPFKLQKIKLVMDNSKEKRAAEYLKKIDEVMLHGECD